MEGKSFQKILIYFSFKFSWVEQAHFWERLGLWDPRSASSLNEKLWADSTYNILTHFLNYVKCNIAHLKSVCRLKTTNRSDIGLHNYLYTNLVFDVMFSRHHYYIIIIIIVQTQATNVFLF